MGNGEVERALTLASRDLAATGITNPTPEQLEAALMGGSVTNAQGQTTSMDGVLTLRSQGMGWGQIAHTIGVHPSQSAQGAANSRRAAAGSNSSSTPGSLSGRSDRSSPSLSAASDRNQLSQGATAISSSSATANARVGERDTGAQQAQDSRLAARSSTDTARLDTRINNRISDNGSDRGRSPHANSREARSTATIGGRGDVNASRGNGRSSASAAGAESIFNGPTHAGAGASTSHSRAPGMAKSKSGPGTAASSPGGSAGGSFSASAGGTSAGTELGGGAGIGSGHGHGKGGGKGK